MGCGPARSAPGSAQFGEATGTFWLDDVECKGHEVNLFQCPSNPVGKHNCNAGEAAAVTCSDLIQIRLVNGTDACSGSVELNYKDIWGAVCDDAWDLQDANVACKQMGCGPARSAPGNAQFGEATGTFWLDDVECKGHEVNLFQCPSNPVGKHNCNAGEAAAVTCSDRPPKPILSLDVKREVFTPKETLQLKCTTQSYYVGSTFYLKKTGDSSFGDTQTAPEGAYSMIFFIHDMDLSHSGNYTCHYQTNKSGLARNSSSSDSVNVVVTDLIQIRLVNGTDACSGRVELNYKDIWGAVCDDAWDLQDANVACKQMGCGPARSAPGSAQFGEATGTFWLDDVECKGHEVNLFQCLSNSVGKHNCNAGEAAAVTCSDRPPKPILSLDVKREVFTPKETLQLKCTTQSYYVGSTFYLKKTGDSSFGDTQTAPEGAYSMIFFIHDMDLSHSGNYTCHYQTNKSGLARNSSSSDSVNVVVTERL
ncbi:deleted in malignant brain tumors 1 protein-like [Hemiscyllium ocellatum]|uniref:deleted in malignant brain tumors 1 protein-like n=1 Tax=Hemiscyllium ocellatum TaxID=170820 RepID=UPI0029664772|nr:deleted in malignant brain tumors 1 protein-like [Hemiscyllium ocellatum]